MKGNESPSISAKTTKPKPSSKKFDKMFGKKLHKPDVEEVAAPAGVRAAEGSVEYWNQIREGMGMKKLKE